MKDCLTKILANDRMPSPPSVAAEILKLAAQSDSTIEQVTQAISADPKLSCRLIAYCNSPIIGSRREIGSLPQAVVTLGMRTVRLISLSFSLIETRDDEGFDYRSFWQRSLATAIASQLIGKRASGNASESFLQGLVLNIGEIGIANTFPKLFGELYAGNTEDINTTAESETLGVNRYEVGARMLEKWHFPAAMYGLLDAHDPDNLTHQSKPFHLAQMVGQLLIDDQPSVQRISEVKLYARAWFGLEEIEFSELFDEMVEHWESYQYLFQFEAVPFDSLSFLEETPKERLLELALGMEREIATATAETSELKMTALIDVLTKLKNRRAYEAEVPGVVDYHRRQNKSFGILVIDIDHFKMINDNYGHAAGDAVLNAVGEILKQKCRKYDTVYRYGGEEFVATIVDCDEESIVTISNRFRQSIEDLRVPYQDDVLRITASIGVCWAENGEIDSLGELFRIADARLYQAKHSGRNCCVVREGHLPEAQPIS